MGALINVWLCRLKDVVHNADNLLIEDLRSKGEKFTCSTTLMDEECLAINSCRRPYIFDLQGGSLNSLLAESTWSVSTLTIVGALEFEIDLLSPHCAITHSMSGTPLSSHKHHLPPLKYVFMSDWWLAKPCLPLQGLAVGGIAYGQRERMFLSTVIAKRHEANVLETEDGVTLHFSSFINSSRSFQNGFPREVCEDFLLGFPDDWQKYTAHSFRAKCVDGDTGFCELNASLHKRAIDPIPFSIRDNRSAERHDFSLSNDGILEAKTNICNEPENSIVNVLKQSVSKNSVECSNIKKTVEGERKDNIVSLKSSQSPVDTMDDGENGVLVAAPISQVGNPNNDQSLTGVFDRSPCKVHSGKSMVGSPVSTTKIRVTQSSGDCKEEHSPATATLTTTQPQASPSSQPRDRISFSHSSPPPAGLPAAFSASSSAHHFLRVNVAASSSPPPAVSVSHRRRPLLRDCSFTSPILLPPPTAPLAAATQHLHAAELLSPPPSTSPIASN
ncbi:hypothetical protein AHAS_Ahas03G0136400 [Arachis hypogaea]